MISKECRAMWATGCFVLLFSAHYVFAILPVQDNEIREAKDLTGLWSFVRDQRNGGDGGILAHWEKTDISYFENASVMPVPSAYNDLDGASLRDHVGWVWYQRIENIPQRHSDRRVFIRVDSANYYAVVFMNGVEIGRHVGGHLPFEFEITKQTKFGMANRISIAVNNTLAHHTIPQGEFTYLTGHDTINGSSVDRYAPGTFKMRGNMDFFNYAGLLRPVRLLFRPAVYIDSFSITADDNGAFSYSATATDGGVDARVIITNSKGDLIWMGKSLAGNGQVDNAQLWWPRGMGKPNLYTIEVQLMDGNTATDVFRTTFGFRSVTWDNNKIYINGKHFYCQGFGMHEEADIRGRAYDSVFLTKDLNNIEWINANCFRTSHYPYSEERMAECDRRGIAVIVETTAVAVGYFTDANLELHKGIVIETITRDRHHPSVFMWSMANEPSSSRKEAREYFQKVIDVARSLDGTRPITAVIATQPGSDVTADLYDVICVNRYDGWYADMGLLDQITRSFIHEFTMWKEKFNRPIFITEYGAESIPGLLTEPPFDFGEQYQVEVLRKTHEAIDNVSLAGELVWVYADFMTGMDTTRAYGNHKGLFTRQRQAKQAAYVIRDRYSKRINTLS